MARASLGGELTAFEVMWNAYYRLTVERVKGVAGPLPTHHPFYVLLEASGSDPERIHADLEKLLETAMGDDLILDATLSTSQCISRRDLAHPRFQRRTWPQLSLRRTDGLRRQPRHRPDGGICRYDRCARQSDRSASLRGRDGTRRRRQSASQRCITKHTPEKHDEFEKLVYDLTGEFGGSISAEHGIGILKRPYLKMSRTEEEIETMRTLKRALDPKNILNPGRIFTM